LLTGRRADAAIPWWRTTQQEPQKGGYIPQAMGKDGGVGFDDPSQDDYGKTDCGDD